MKEADVDFWDYGERIYPPQAVVGEYLEPLARLYSAGRVVADLGCGRGEFLSVLRRNGHEALGVDISARSREMVSAQGFAFYFMDIFDFLENPPATYNALFSYGLIEHLDAPSVARLFRTLGKRCAPDTEAIFATHNPKSVQALTLALFSELSHQRLYSQELIEFLFEANDFEVRQSGALLQPQRLISDQALATEPNEEFIRSLNLRGVERRSGPLQLDDLKYLAGRVQVIELVLDQIVSLLNTPLDYYVMARKK
ncbi:MAG TPA: class I SAM-dependent methyltransferase [Acidobacteriota bacterium]|nr:class I SAM-dependent methyltransferase [Acidobacteriota bacterium]